MPSSPIPRVLIAALVSFTMLVTAPALSGTAWSQDDTGCEPEPPTPPPTAEPCVHPTATPVPQPTATTAPTATPAPTATAAPAQSTPTPSATTAPTDENRPPEELASTGPSQVALLTIIGVTGGVAGLMILFNSRRRAGRTG